MMSDEQKILREIGRAPEWFENQMADWLVQFGPDRHSDGYQVIAALAWHSAERGPLDWKAIGPQPQPT
jgi:hypothetical protein